MIYYKNKRTRTAIKRNSFLQQGSRDFLIYFYSMFYQRRFFKIVYFHLKDLHKKM